MTEDDILELGEGTCKIFLGNRQIYPWCAEKHTAQVDYGDAGTNGSIPTDDEAFRYILMNTIRYEKYKDDTSETPRDCDLDEESKNKLLEISRKLFKTTEQETAK